MFCALFWNKQHFLKNKLNILKQIVWETLKCHISVRQVILEKLKNYLAYWNFNAIFEFLRQFASGCLHYFENSVNNFEIAHMVNFEIYTSSLL